MPVSARWSRQHFSKILLFPCHKIVLSNVYKIEYFFQSKGGIRMTRAYLATAAAVLALALAVFCVVSVLPF